MLIKNADIMPNWTYFADSQNTTEINKQNFIFNVFIPLT